MKIYVELFKALFSKYMFKENNGTIVKRFAENSGIAYIKLAQILSTLNFGNLFNEEDRIILSSICDDCNPVDFKVIKKILKKEYGKNFRKIFKYIDEKPVGSASVSQVHRVVLMNGDEAVVKVKRIDVARDVDRDISLIKKFIYRYGKVFGFGNFKGANLVLDLYSSWILEEINFENEIKNIKRYSKYTNDVNGKVFGTCKLMVPKVYEEYSTANVIVMGFVRDKTINKLKLNSENKQKIIYSINSYIELNFWAMFNDRPICFHGDPHSGNLAIDDNGNLWFLDFGLLFVLSEEESRLCRDFFLTIYSGDYEKLYNMLIIYADLNDLQKREFKKNIKNYIDFVKDKNVTHYFIDLISICLGFNFVPPSFFINMAKAFICVYGICNYSDNDVGARELLKMQILLFLIKKNVKNFIFDFEELYKFLNDFIC